MMAADEAIVVEVNVSLTPPTVRTVLVAVELLDEEVCRTANVSPFWAVPALET
jgi:hypothetical protein